MQFGEGIGDNAEFVLPGAAIVPPVTAEHALHMSGAS
eukprot:SAG31_NODE_11730_length_1002_cov_1.479513_1_plen_36_part_10